MAALISGLLELFDPSKYIQHFEQFVKANDIPEERKKSVFLTAIGYDSYEVLANFFKKPEQETLKTLKAELEKHFNSKSSVIAERYKFGCRHQKESESTADFAAGLCKFAARCNLKKALLDEALRNKFMCGLQHECSKSRLLTEEDNLTFNRSVEIATGLEGAKKHAHLMQQEIKKEEDNTIHSTQGHPLLYVFIVEVCTRSRRAGSSKNNATTAARLATCLRCVRALPQSLRSLKEEQQRAWTL